MTDDKQTAQDAYLLILALTLVIIGLSWMAYFADALLVDNLKGNWPKWYGLKWFEDSAWHTIPVFLFVNFGPASCLIGLAAWLIRHILDKNFAAIHNTNLKDLGKAKIALQQCLISVEAIDKEYRGKLKSFELLQSQLEELQSVKDIDTIELRKKLNAIAQVSRNNVWFERILGFIIGITSSLFASYIWEYLR
jgi:hypothetical protein